MTRCLFTIALLTGTIAVGWIAAVIADTNFTALAVTLVIGGVYSIGAVELLHFRRATSTLFRALTAIQEKAADFDAWLETLDASIRNAVRLRIEGERVGLPAPMLTPYLIGLLVMLGLLGTFIGMVVTFKGAVSALEGAVEIQAIRDGLAGPIRGLALAFGTSVAGVASSAMLGLMATLSRRDRVLATRCLDARAAIAFRELSPAHQQRETFRAIRLQTRALPELVDKVGCVADRLDGLGDRLLDNQDRFHASVKTLYADLAASVNGAHREHLKESVRMIGERIEPMLRDTLTEITVETKEVQKLLSRATAENLKDVSTQLVTMSSELNQSHLESLVKKMEAPMKDFIRAAAEVPLASAQIIDQLRREASQTAGLESRLLEAHGGIMAGLDQLSNTMAAASNRQHEAVEHLVASSKGLLEESSRRFTEQVGAETSHLAKVSEDFAVSAVEMASLGEAFGAAVSVFSAASQALMENLGKIEESLDRTASRSDEQLAYYVAQAREIVDQCMLAQREVFEELRRLDAKQDAQLEADQWKN